MNGRLKPTKASTIFLILLFLFFSYITLKRNTYPLCNGYIWTETSYWWVPSKHDVIKSPTGEIIVEGGIELFADYPYIFGYFRGGRFILNTETGWIRIVSFENKKYYPGFLGVSVKYESEDLVTLPTVLKGAQYNKRLEKKLRKALTHKDNH